MAVAACGFPGLRLAGDAAVDAPAAAEASVDASGSTDVPIATDAPSVDARTLTATPTPSCPLVSERGCAKVLVEGGTFTLGAEGRVGPAQPGVSVDDFVGDATEVTVRRFRRYVAAVDAGQVAGRLMVDYPPPQRSHFSVETSGLGSHVGTDAMCTWSASPRDDRDDAPVNCVNWSAAMAFCMWDRGRLPTEAELEYVARWWRTGGTPRTYAWGEQAPDCARAQWRASDPGGCPGDDGLSTRRVGSLPAGAVFGVHDLAGNLSEWCADDFLPYAPRSAPNECWGRGAARNPVCRSASTTDRTLRGGDWLTHAGEAAQLEAVARVGALSRSSLPLHGFRCARSP